MGWLGFGSPPGGGVGVRRGGREGVIKKVREGGRGMMRALMGRRFVLLISWEVGRKEVLLRDM